MRHYTTVPEGDEIEVTFVYYGLPPVKRLMVAPSRVVAELEAAGQREPFMSIPTPGPNPTPKQSDRG